MRAALSGVLGLLLLAGTPACYSVTVRSGRPPAPEPPSGFDGQWRSAVLGDIVEIDQPVPLNRLCKAGWAEIHQERTPVNWLADVFLAGFFYESQKLTLRCGEGSAPPVVVVPVQPGQTVIVQPVSGPGTPPAPPATLPAPPLP